MKQAYGKAAVGKSRIGLLVMIAMLAGGCAGAASTSSRTGPVVAAPIRFEPWDAQHPHTRCIVTPHYRLYTDLEDPEAQAQLGEVMEGAMTQYRMFCPNVPVSNRPLEAFVFARRAEWAEFTRLNAGADAPVYLKINRGAYALEDRFVAFWIGDRGTFSVMGHEGWHQFVARNFVGRILPAMEEGLACLFEDVEWEGGLPRWDLTESPVRVAALTDAVEAGQLWPLDQLLRLHAGDVIGLPRERVDTFYAQTWALALFLWTGENGRHRPALRRYLCDIASGTAYRPPGLEALAQRQWRPELGAGQFEHYFQLPLSQLDAQYRRFCRELIRRRGV